MDFAYTFAQAMVIVAILKTTKSMDMIVGVVEVGDKELFNYPMAPYVILYPRSHNLICFYHRYTCSLPQPRRGV